MATVAAADSTTKAYREGDTNRVDEWQHTFVILVNLTVICVQTMNRGMHAHME